jgi:hypothetical protein
MTALALPQIKQRPGLIIREPAVILHYMADYFRMMVDIVLHGDIALHGDIVKIDL